MATTSIVYPGLTGVQSTFAIPFEYLARAHVKVNVDGEPVETGVSFTSPFMLDITPAPVGDLRVYRQTPSDDPINTFQDGSVLLSGELNDSFIQSIFISQEVEGSLPGKTPEGNWDMDGLRLANVGSPVDPDDAVTKEYLEFAYQSGVDAGAAAAAAAASAAASAASALDAADEKTAAQAARSQAQTAQTAAGVSEVNAAASAAAALAYRNTAETHKNNAAQSALDADADRAAAQAAQVAAGVSQVAAAASAANAATDSTRAIAGGIGSTGSSPTVPDLDTTAFVGGKASATSTATGTWPAPAAQAVIEYNRFSSTAGLMALTYVAGANAGRKFERTLAGGTWGVWRRLVKSDEVILGSRTPEHHGALGDGSTDDTVAIQACLNAGGTIVFAPGKSYKITGTVEITQNGTTIIGYGSALRHETSSLTDVLLCREKMNINIIGLEIDGRRSLKSAAGQSETRGIQLYSCTDVTIRDCYVHDTLERGIRSANEVYSTVKVSNYIRILNNRIQNCGNATPERGTGIWFFGEHWRSVIAGNTITECVGGGITVDDVSSSGPTGLANEYLVIANNVVYYNSFDPGTTNSIGIWVGGSRYVSVTGNTVRGYRNACMVEDSQANELCAYITITGNTFWGGPVALLVRNASNVTVSGNTLRATMPPSGSYSGEATGVLIYGYGSSTANRVKNISVTGNTIISDRRGVSFHSPGYHTPVANGVIGVDIKNNSFIHTSAVTSNDNAVDVNDGGVANSVRDVVVEGNTADGFYIGYRYGSGITTQCIFQRNTAQNCTQYGFQITANEQLLVGNTSRGNAVGVRVEANSATVLVKDHTFIGDTANTSGTSTSVTKMNNYPTF